MLRKILFLTVLALSGTVYLAAQNFEGLIEFKKKTGTDETNYVYYVKGDKVRIDEFAPGTHIPSASFIVDTKAGTMIYLNNDRKLWGTRQPKGTPAAPADAKVTSTKNTKDLFGYKCNEQIVTCASDSTQISYWVAPGKFAFFLPLLKLLDRQEKLSTYFFALTSLKAGSFPMLAIQKDLKGNEISRLEVTRLEAKTLPDDLFTVPANFTQVK